MPGQRKRQGRKYSYDTNLSEVVDEVENACVIRAATGQKRVPGRGADGLLAISSREDGRAVRQLLDVRCVNLVMSEKERADLIETQGGRGIRRARSGHHTSDSKLELESHGHGHSNGAHRTARRWDDMGLRNV